jgi:hypothetical protein
MHTKDKPFSKFKNPPRNPKMDTGRLMADGGNRYIFCLEVLKVQRSDSILAT